MQWSEVQAGFAAAVRDPERAQPPSVTARSAPAVTRRFDVYRNNSAVSLVDALADSFPVVQELVGEAFFGAMAKSFVERNLPQSPVLLEYGAGFPVFIASFPPAAELPFLADVACVERAWLEAYHAADAEPLPITALNTLDQARLVDARFRLHPSIRTVACELPGVSIWQAHNTDDAHEKRQLLGAIVQQPESVLIVRPGFDVEVRLVAEQVLRTISTLHAGGRLGEAVEAAGLETADELAGMLRFVFEAGAIVALEA